jgi:hypothetical protein
MLPPQEKAKELINKMYKINEIGFGSIEFTEAKEGALIAANEAKKCTKYEKQLFENDRFSEDYWKLVEQEINK